LQTRIGRAENLDDARRIVHDSFLQQTDFFENIKTEHLQLKLFTKEFGCILPQKVHIGESDKEDTQGE
jgi:hypothetical protein